jgi:HEPN domain-containing protein
MKNITLAEDYITRAGHRLEAVSILMERKSYPDVVRESQEVVELCTKALLRHCNMEVPRLPDVSDILKSEKNKLPKETQAHVERLSRISKELRRDRELAFYGAEDLTPMNFYQEEDALKALQDARWVHQTCKEAMGLRL